MTIDKNSLQASAINSSIDQLIEEATSLFKTFDHISASICTLEAKLNEAKAFFPFWLNIKKDPESPTKKPESYHVEQSSFTVLGYHTATHWHLSWESQDENSKTFRIFLVGEEKETVWFEKPDGDGCWKQEGRIKNIFKKPLMETNLATRIQYSQHLPPFIHAFTTYLNDCRKTLLSDDLPF